MHCLRIALRWFVAPVVCVAGPAEASAAPPMFTARIEITNIARQVMCMATGDLNGSGRMDAVSGSQVDLTLRWYENLGGEPPEFTIHDVQVNLNETDGSPRHVAIADVNRDGCLDIVVVWSAMHRVRWYENDGQSPPNFTVHDIFTNNSFINGMAVADFTGDGRVDVAVCDGTRVLLLSRLGGGEAWSSTQIAPTGGASLFVGDIDGDGRVDLAMGTWGQTINSVIWFRNIGGSPPSFVPHTVFSDAGIVRAVHVADVDGDGHLDIISASETQNVVRLHRNDGADPSNWSTQIVDEGAVGAKALAVADFNKSGRLDIVSGSRTDHTVRWHENLGGEPVQFQAHTITRDARWVEAVAVADIDGDGCIDIVSASAGDSTVRWHRNDLERPGRVAFVKHTIDFPVGFARDVSVADLTGDGAPDIISTTYLVSSVRWFENLGGAEPQFLRRSIIEGGAFIYYTWPADINGDGALDIVIGGSSSPHVWWRQNSGASPPTFLSRVIGSNGSYAVRAADLDGDGDMDAISFGSGLAWHENVGFIPNNLTTMRVIAGGTVHDAAPVDLDDDSDIDIVTAHSAILWHENDGGQPPKFTTRDILTGDGAYRCVFPIDLNRNGRIDIVAGNAGRLIWLENMGGSPPVFTRHAVEQGRATAVWAMDIDNDGDIDIIASSEDGDSIRWHENIGGDPPRFIAQVVYTEPGRASVWVADINGDGALDIVASLAGPDTPQGEVAWFQNLGDVPRTPDLNGDGVVNAADLAILLGAWGMCDGPCPADINRDGVVNASDLARLLGAWGA